MPTLTMENDTARLAELVDSGKPRMVLEEVRTAMLDTSPDFDFEPIEIIFKDIVRLFIGRYPGYRKCSTGYHDLEHTMDTFLAMARLIHGACISGQEVSGKNAGLGLVSALMHDTGYILKDCEEKGTGAQFTSTHISRSIEFASNYFFSGEYPPEYYELCRCSLLCTGLNVQMDKVPFPCGESELIGKMLGTADILGQLASPVYLAKLPVLFNELKEGMVLEQESEYDFLMATPRFYETARERLESELGGVCEYMRSHLRERWGIDEDLYMAAIENNLARLESIMKKHPRNYRSFLRNGCRRSTPARVAI